MLKNYLIITLRNIRKNKLYSFINMAGLAVGMACCVLIFLWVQDELSFDRFHENSAQLYRVVGKFDDKWYNGSPWALAPVLKKEYPEIIKSTRFAGRTLLVRYKDLCYSKDIAFVEPDFLDMFSFPMQKGEFSSVLETTNSALISHQVARQFFGSEDPIGKVITVNQQQDFIVAGIFEDVPANSSITFDVIASVKIFGEERLNSWALESNAYVMLEKNVSLSDLRDKIAGITNKYDKRTNKQVTVDLEPLSRMHLYSLNGAGSIVYIYIFSTIAIFILLIACINFMNLSTAKAGNRAKEISMRKVVGARRTDVLRQFFGEALVMAGIALIIALGLVLLFLPKFNFLAQKEMRLDLAGNHTAFIGLILVTIFTGIVAGSYPALFLSSFQPVKILKGGLKAASGGSTFRKILVVVQFTIAITLIIGTIFMYRQLNYIQNKNLGFERDHIISITMNEDIRKSYQAFKEEILTNSSVLNVTAANNRPTNIGNINPVYWEGRTSDQYEIMNFASVDYDYIETFEMQMDAGRSFSREFSTDKENYIINEEAVKFAGLEDPVGKLFSIWTNEGKIIGVVKNFHSRPLHQQIAPIVLTLNPAWRHSFVFVKIGTDDVPGTLAYLEKTWKNYAPNFPFGFQFMDEAFNDQYHSDRRISAIFQYFTVMAIFISGLGLFGLASYMAEQRTKEIGVRKVLGASILNILSLISREFMGLLIVANIFAWPIAYFFMEKMLGSYAYRINTTIWVFLAAGLFAITISLLMVSYQALKAARVNPVNSLKYE